MKKNYTHISIVLDRSGSMAGLANDVVGGFNKFMDEQELVPGEATATLVQFDTDYELLYNGVALKDAPDRTTQNYIPRGGTALYDAACRCIDETGRFLASLSEDARPEKAVFVIITDGQENSSHEHSKADLQARIKTQSEVFKWQFVYLSSDPCALVDAADLGFQKTSAAMHVNSANGVAQMYNGTADAVRSYRTGETLNVNVSKVSGVEQSGSSSGS